MAWAFVGDTFILDYLQLKAFCGERANTTDMQGKGPFGTIIFR